jgi:hypothetical protein
LRKVAPLYDILLQVRSDLWKHSAGIAERAGLFTSFFHELSNQKEPVLIVNTQHATRSTQHARLT